jgi:hypothetical protein
MEPEGSISCLKVLSTGPYPEPDQSISYHHTLSLQTQYYSYYYPLTYVFVLK